MNFEDMENLIKFFRIWIFFINFEDNIDNVKILFVVMGF